MFGFADCSMQGEVITSAAPDSIGLSGQEGFEAIFTRQEGEGISTIVRLTTLVKMRRISPYIPCILRAQFRHLAV